MSALAGTGALIRNDLFGQNKISSDSNSYNLKQTMSINDAKKNLSLYDEVDVLVCGGGLGGVAAAIASALLAMVSQRMISTPSEYINDMKLLYSSYMASVSSGSPT